MSHQEHTEHQERQGGGRGGGYGHGRGEGRGHRFERGDLRYVLLERLADQPAHGYELIRALEERFHGFYSPSPGVVYPTLQWLEDLGYVTAAEADGRKVYTITEQGRSFLAAGGPRVAEIDQRLRGWMGPFDRREYRAEIEGIQDDLQGMAQALREAGSRVNPERLRRVREVTRRARQEVEVILGEPDSRPGDDPLGAAAREEPRHI
jgi:DNA-binding PadR family transcriptional regulator